MITMSTGVTATSASGPVAAGQMRSDARIGVVPPALRDGCFGRPGTSQPTATRGRVEAPLLPSGTGRVVSSSLFGEHDEGLDRSCVHLVQPAVVHHVRSGLGVPVQVQG